MNLKINQNSYWNYNRAWSEKSTAQSIKIVDEEWKTIQKEIDGKLVWCILRLKSDDFDSTDELKDMFERWLLCEIINKQDLRDDSNKFFLEVLYNNYELIKSNFISSREEDIKKKIESLQKKIESWLRIDDIGDIVEEVKDIFNKEFWWYKKMSDESVLNDLVEWSDTYNRRLEEIEKYKKIYKDLEDKFYFIK